MNVAKNLSWKFLIANNPIKKWGLKGKTIGYHHGSMFGNNTWSLRTVLNSDYFFTLSDAEHLYIKRHLGEKSEKTPLFTVGNPKLTKSLNYSKSSPHYKNSYVRRKKIEHGLDSDKPVIAFTSHWTSEGNIRTYGPGIIEALAYNFPNHHVVVNFHPKIFENPQSEPINGKIANTSGFHFGWIWHVLKKLESSRIIKLWPHGNQFDMLAVSDVVICDKSSIFIETLPFELPIFAKADLNYYDKSIEEIVKNRANSFSSIENLIKILREHFSYTSQGRDVDIKRDAAKELFIHNDGNASSNFLRILENIEKEQSQI